MTLLKSFIRKNEALSTVIAVVLIITAGCFIFPLLINFACKALLFMMNDPVTSLMIIGAFLIGMFFNEVADKFDSK